MKQLTFTIFGGTGDLTFRKLVPAFYNLMKEHKIHDELHLVIIGRRAYTTEQYCDLAQPWVKEFSRIRYTDEDYQIFTKHLEYVQMDFADNQAYYVLNTFYQNHQDHHHIFYLAVAPRFFQVITQGLQAVDDAQNGKVIVEKPFGEDLASAKHLNANLEAFFGKHHVFHIDHYLGKEMVRNMQAIRFMNPVFQHVWSKEYIEHIQISASEVLGVENRGDYYDKSGALKDMVQNHLFQILSIVAMEEPSQFFETDMQVKQRDVIQSLRPVQALDIRHSMVLGQYDQYLQEAKVDALSQTETYAALRLFIDNSRWYGIPFYIRTGKKLRLRETEVIITFKKHMPHVEANVLVIKIQPEEGVYFQFNMKRPGESEDIILSRMDFCQSCIDQNRLNTPEAYERLLLAAVNDDTAWFSKWEQIETSWKYIDELKQRFQEGDQIVYPYVAGSDGPLEADMLLANNGHHWFLSEPE